MKVLGYLINRLGEASTWRGLIMLGIAVGLKVTPEQATAIMTLGTAAAGTVGVFFPDAKK